MCTPQRKRKELCCILKCPEYIVTHTHETSRLLAEHKVKYYAFNAAQVIVQGWRRLCAAVVARSRRELHRKALHI